MKTIKGNKKEIINQYIKYCDDLKLIKKYIASIEIFTKNYIENEIKLNGLFYNKKFKTIDLQETEKEIFNLLYKNFINNNYLKINKKEV